MKLLLVLLSILNCSFLTDNLSEKLCKDNEEVIFSFKLIKNKKVVSVCKDKNDKYIVYRFGSKDSIELTYPKTSDKNSWNNFKYYSTHRGGGKSNAAFGDVWLSFINENVEYKVFHFWGTESSTNEIGIEIKVNGKSIKMKGDLNSQAGALQDLDFSDFIKNQAEE